MAGTKKRTKVTPKSRKRVQKEMVVEDIPVDTQPIPGAPQPGELLNPELATPAPTTSLPPELLQALTAEANPYELLGREYARRVQLEGVVSAMQAFLRTLVGQ